MGNNHAMLSAEELERYARHIVLREVGGPGQAALKEAALALGYVSEQEFDRIVDPAKMVRPYVAAAT